MGYWFVHADCMNSGYVTVIAYNNVGDLGQYLADGVMAAGMTTRLVDRDDRVRTIHEMQCELGVRERDQRRFEQRMRSGGGHTEERSDCRRTCGGHRLSELESW